jgi:uncharacterized protein (UPF0332 family)
VEKGRLLQVQVVPEQLARELEEAGKDHAQADRRFASGRFDEAAVHAYHAMYHAARTLLLARGYRERNLYCLATGLRRFYVTPGLLEENLLRTLAQMKDIRDRVTSGGRSDRAEAQSAVAASAAMLERVRAILGEEAGSGGKHAD